ncbi:MAG: T9SS C-terminal target domain-containing protein [Bacteroidetes bacterium]|nr:MAG: T9SS C-terminal target domain-containing protein [Bacteroidota bacterium]
MLSLLSLYIYRKQDEEDVICIHTVYHIYMRRNLLLICTLAFVLPLTAQQAQHSVAREWNEVQLKAIRKDLARPTVQARNLFHISAAMYDAWAAYDATATPFLLGRAVGTFISPFEGVTAPADIEAARKQAISFAASRMIAHRYKSSPGGAATISRCDSLLRALGYDADYASLDYSNGNPAALGNYIADQYIQFGLQDGSNEGNSYTNRYYAPVNQPYPPFSAFKIQIQDPNRWQPLEFNQFIDQNGNVIPGTVPAFLTPEWGQVIPFSLKPEDKTVYERDGFEYWVYHDPGPIPQLDPVNGGAESEEYRWTHSLTAIWAGHLDPADSVMWDISPASLGNIDAIPETLEGIRALYNYLEGGDIGTGRSINPYTGLPYEPQIVPRGDYSRVLAEFWADGPNSETPPGHWFSILNYVCDRSELKRQYNGEGPEMSPLEWDIKCYFTLGGAMHDAAICAWGVKGWYDSVRPISAIRYMASQGQSSDPSLPSYSPAGLPLVPGKIELIRAGDALAGPGNVNVGKIKIKAWRGHAFISTPTDVAGVDWILGETWWPYQRPSFVTPPFAGYVSGHSTYSRAAAEALTLLTGDEYFPGGMAEFHALKNNFLVFEEGPSVDVVLQWATYRDASAQTSLSRIWGGIHPPIDDIPGRKIGKTVGIEAFEHARKYFTGEIPDQNIETLPIAFPNPVSINEKLSVVMTNPASEGTVQVITLHGQLVYENSFEAGEQIVFFQVDPATFVPGIYIVRVAGKGWQRSGKVWVKP